MHNSLVWTSLYGLDTSLLHLASVSKVIGSSSRQSCCSLSFHFLCVAVSTLSLARIYIHVVPSTIILSQYSKTNTKHCRRNLRPTLFPLTQVLLQINKEKKRQPFLFWKHTGNWWEHEKRLKKSETVIKIRYK